MKIMAVCGSGLGSSFILEMNIENILKKLGVSGVEVEHTDLGSATKDITDVFIAAKDIADGMDHLGEVIVLDTLLDNDTLEVKLEDYLKSKGLLH